MKISLYAAFAFGSGLMVLKSPEPEPISPTPAPNAEISLQMATYAFVLALTALAMFHINHQTACRRNSRVVLVLGGIFLQLLMVQLVMTLTHGSAIPEAFRFLLVPFAFAPMLHGVLMGQSVGLFSTVYASLIGSLLVSGEDFLGFLILSLVSGMTAVLLTKNVRKRGQLLRAGIYVGGVTILIAMVLGRLDVASCFGPEAVDRLQLLGKGSALAFATAMFTALFISGLLPFFESVFRLTTDISWLELSDLNHKLLRKMQLEAPGTFHHSLVVASLAEAAAEKIGANAPMCRVCAYFHDIGKLKKPGYFIENQSGAGEGPRESAENPHDALTPTMSALIIIAHVKDGVDLAVKHKLNPRIIDVIQEHHGDSLVQYFYRKAQEQKRAELEKVDRGLENPEDLPQVDQKNFRYPGPRPSSRESAIIAMADTIESASRTLQKPTPAKIRALIDELVRAKVVDGQFSDCDLTLGELAIVKDSFATTLRSMMHSRIDYPKDETVTKRPQADTTRVPAADTTRGGRIAARATEVV